MSTVFPPPQTEDQANGVRATTPRIYSPYVFQPNFLKQRVLDNRNNNVPPSLNRLLNTENFVKNNQTLPNTQMVPQANKPFLQHSFLDPEMQGRKKMGRRVIDWTSSCVLYVENRIWQNSTKDVPLLQPDTSYTMELQIPIAYKLNPVTSVSTKFIRSATNKMKCPVYKVVWTPDGRRLVTGSSSGEFTLWNGTAFNFETILQAHDCAVRAMAWSKNDSWLITGDNQGYVKYWQLNMNNVKMFQAHKDQACRSLSFCPTDHKFATASDDGTVRVWDFMRCQEEKILRGHGADVKQVDWHPHKGLVASASKDLHTPVKLWDPKSGQSLTTLHGHKGTVMDLKWNQNGNWLLSASRDHLIKIYDLRNLKQEMQVFRGHKKEAFSVAWHPIHEGLFASGGSEGSIMFWKVGEEKEVGVLEGAHDSLIWSLAWHPLGHVLTSGSNDHSTKFWARNRPGDTMRDRYNQYLLPNGEVTVGTDNKPTENDNSGEVVPMTTPSIIPGMGDADLAKQELAKRQEDENKDGIPGLDWSYEEKHEFSRKLSNMNDFRKKIPYSRPVPRAFMAAWDSNKEGNPEEEYYGRAPLPDMYREREFPPRNRRHMRPPHPHDEEFHRPFPPSPERRIMNREQFPRMHHPQNLDRPDSFSDDFPENENIPPDHRNMHHPHPSMGPDGQNIHQNMPHGPNQLPNQQNIPPNQHNMIPEHNMQANYQRPQRNHMNPSRPMNRPPEHNMMGNNMDNSFQGPRPRMDRPWPPPHQEEDYNEGEKMQYNNNTPMSDGNVMFFDDDGEPLPSLDDSPNFQPNNNNFFNDSFQPEPNQMHPPRMRGRGFGRGRGHRPGFHPPRGGRGDGGPGPRFMEPNRGGWMRGRGGSPPHQFQRGRGRP